MEIEAITATLLQLEAVIPTPLRMLFTGSRHPRLAHTFQRSLKLFLTRKLVKAPALPGSTF
jgi:hypothetical protein